MNGRAFEPDLIVGWPTAEISVMGPEGAVNIIFRKQIEAAGDAEARDAVRNQLVATVRSQIGAYVAAGWSFLDDLIDPFFKLRIRTAVSREAHEFVLAVIGTEAEIFGKRRVKPSKRMRHFALIDRSERVAAMFPQNGTVFVARSIDRETQRFVKAGLHCRLKCVCVVMRSGDNRRQVDVAVRASPFELMTPFGRSLVKSSENRALPYTRRVVSGKLTV